MMPLGPGKYDDLASYVRERADAEGVIVIVVNGRQGNGFSVQGTATVTLKIPDLLDIVANEIRASFVKGEI
jgi:hypothetical protein